MQLKNSHISFNVLYEDCNKGMDLQSWVLVDRKVLEMKVRYQYFKKNRVDVIFSEKTYN
jgi:hypothetical protein